jgi:tetratricopeptide (TPR) repeat protein
VKEFYTAIAEVYQEVARVTPAHQGNPCGDCRSCCTSAIKSHKVTELELATMAFHLGQPSVDKFRRFLNKERDKTGALVFTQCPNLGQAGCTVHEHRPLSCRSYGHFRSQSAELFEHCVFRGQETVYPDELEHLLSPGQVRLTELSIEYLSYFPGAAHDRPIDPLKVPRTDLEMASHLQIKGEYQAAIDILLRLSQSEDSANILCMLAECYGHLRDYATAVTTLDRAIIRSPKNAELYASKGANLLWAGRLPEAKIALERSLELAPDRRNALGLLGFIHQLSGDLLAAQQCLGRAVELEDEPGPYRLQLALVLKSLGRLAECRSMLALARDYQPTAPQAEQALAELDS